MCREYERRPNTRHAGLPKMEVYSHRAGEVKEDVMRLTRSR